MVRGEKIPSLAGCKRKLKGRNRLDNGRWRSVGGAGKLEIARQPRNREEKREEEVNEGENREAARKTLREKSVFTFRPESQCRILLPRETTEQNGGWGHPWPLHLSQPALRLGMQMRAAPSLLPPYRVPFRVFHPFDITTSPTSSKVSRYRRISASATRRGLRFFCFLSSRKETVDKERNSYLLVVKKKKKKTGRIRG